MNEPLHVGYELTRDDWLAANTEIMAISPYWDAAQRAYRRRSLIQVACIAPIIIGGAALTIGTRQATTGMYVEGALCGLVLVGLMAFGLSRLNVTTGMKSQQMDALRRMDLSEYVGRYDVIIDMRGIEIVSRNVRLNLAWTTVAVHETTRFIVISTGGSSGAVIPKQAFASIEDPAEFVRRAREFWTEAQVPAPERIARYLRDRDVGCPKCAYNLRGVRANTCPECGGELTLESLMKARQ